MIRYHIATNTLTKTSQQSLRLVTPPRKPTTLEQTFQKTTTTNNQIFAYNEGKQNTSKNVNFFKKYVDIKKQPCYISYIESNTQATPKKTQKTFSKKVLTSVTRCDKMKSTTKRKEETT